MALKPANFNSALFLLGLHNFNDREVKHAVKQNQNLPLSDAILRRCFRVWSYVAGMVLNLRNVWRDPPWVGGEIPFPLHVLMPELLPVLWPELAARFKWNLAETKALYVWTLCPEFAPPAWLGISVKWGQQIYTSCVLQITPEQIITTTTEKCLSLTLPLSCFAGKKRNPGLKIPKEAFEQPQTSST